MGIVQKKEWVLNNLLNPKSVAIIGASEKSFYSYVLYENLKKYGFKGDIYPVNPKYSEMFGVECYPSLKDLPQAPDNVFIIVRRELVLNMVKEAISSGAKSATIISAGFSETHEAEWVEVENILKELSIENDFPILGPNCLGAFSTHHNFGGFTAPLRGGMIPGNVALVMQSGGILQGMCFPFYQRGIGLSYAISSGNSMCLDVSEYIDYLLLDEKTDVICAYIEGIKDPERFEEVLEKAARIGKPIIILKVGKSEKAAQATLAHTGSLAGSDHVISAVFEKYGVIRVSDFDELIETAAVFSSHSYSKNVNEDTGIGILTSSGGAVGLVTDLAEVFNIKIADFSEEAKKRLKKILPPSANISNPIDVTGQILYDLDMYNECLTALNEDPKVGIIIDLLPLGLPSNDIPIHKKLLYQTVELANTINKPVVINSINSHSLDEWQKEFLSSNKKIAFTQGVGKTLKAVQSFLDYSYFMNCRRDELLSVRHQTDETRKEIALKYLKSIDRKVLTEFESKKLLSLYEIPVSNERVVKSEEEAVRIANTLKYPVVMKIDSPDILHKSDAGGVKVNLKNDKEVVESYHTILKNAKQYNANAEVGGVLVQEMVSGGTEIIIGVSRDAQFGSVIMFGIGGIFVEVFKDSVFKKLPIGKYEAKSMIEGIKGYPLLKGVRGEAPKDINALTDTLLKISQMLSELDDYIQEMDINPILVMDEGKGVKAVDGLIVLR